MPASVESLRGIPSAPTNQAAADAHLILSHAHEAAKALLDAFDASRTKRRASGGNTTDSEQDLLRAMLVFAGAGLDAAVKRLIQDSLAALAASDASVQQALQAFAARRLRDEMTSAPTTAKGYALLASALSSQSAQQTLVAAYVNDLIGESLQSVERAIEAIGALGIKESVPVDHSALKGVFADRNRIIHEMDMNLSGALRKRKSRSRDSMLRAANQLLGLGGAIVAAVDKKLGAASSSTPKRRKGDA